MSWADDIRCLYCDGRLPLYRKITNGQFCSSAHRKAYWTEQERLALERLHQTHDSLRAYRPKGAVEAILGATDPEPAPQLVSEAPEERPGWLTLVNTGELPVATYIKDTARSQPRWMADRMAGAEPQPIESQNPMRRPVNTPVSYDCGFMFAGNVQLQLSAADAPNPSAETALVPMAVVVYPISQLRRELVPETLELHPVASEQDPAPLSEKFFALTQPAPRELEAAPVASPEPIATAMRAHLPLDVLRLDATLPPATPVEAGLRELPIDRLALVPGPWIDGLRAVDFEAETPQLGLSTPPMRPRLQLAAGRRYAVESREPVPGLAVAETASYPMPPARVSLPDRPVQVLRAATPHESAPIEAQQQEPNPAGLLALACAASPAQSAQEIRPAPAALSLPQPLISEPMRPASKLEPLDAKPISDFDLTPLAAVRPAIEHDHAKVWTHAVDFWKRAPRDLKMLMFAIPVLLGLALHPSLPKVRVAAPAAASGFQRNFHNAVNRQWGSVRQSLLERAAIALDEDFRAGLDDWVSRGDATTDWSFDATGFVRPGPLAMYRPSMGLNDYQLQFLGLIDKKAMSWVVRAVDFDNYYVVKLVVLKSGPLPTIGVTRYAVINGKADSRADTIVPVDAREDMLYRVQMDVHGDDFALTVQGQMVDSWSEPRLTHGGVGFFAAPGEESRLRWVQVTHQYDMLGRLCAYLAPYNIASANGSWQQQ